MKKIFCLLFLFIFSLVFISCDENNPVIDDPVIDDIYYEVKFVIDTKEEVIKVKENTKVTKPVDPEKVGFEFIGWFNDDTLYDFESLVTKDITIIAKFNELKPMLEINVSDNKLNMGYSTQINAKFYNTEEVSLEYKIDQKGIVYIDDKGLVTALRPGVVKITAYTESLVSNEIEIEVLDEIINEEDKIDLKGYTIKTNYYPFMMDGFIYEPDDLTKDLIYFIENLEKEYNFNFEFVDRDPEEEFNYLDFSFSLYGYDKYYQIKYYVDKDKIYDITDLFNKYKEKYPLIMNEYTEFNKYKYHNKLYKLYIPTFTQYQTLYYDLDLLNSLGITDPIDLYLEGKWTYSNFIAWCEEAKSILDKTNKEEEKNIYSSYRYVLAGHEYLWFSGLMSTVNKTIYDSITKDGQFESTESKNIKQLFNYLLDKEMYSKYDYHYECLLHALNNTYANDYRLNFSNIGIVPFPYPDDYNPKDVKYSSDYCSYQEFVFFNSKRSQYPEGVEFEDIFAVICEILNYRYLLSFTDKEKNLSYLKYLCNNEKNLEVYSNLTSEDYIFDPFFCFDDSWEGKHFRSVNLIEDYLYYDNYQELDNYKKFMEYYNFASKELNVE